MTTKGTKHTVIDVLNMPARVSPVEQRRKELPRGNGDWNGFAHVYSNISKACEEMARGGLYLTEEHVNAMAILGCGDEETMKHEQMRLRGRGFIGDRSNNVSPLKKGEFSGEFSGG